MTRVQGLLVLGALSGVLAQAGCQLESLQIPDEVVITCVEDSDCPTGFNCEAGRCFEGRSYTPACGNGLVDDDEVCDDDNTLSGDGCRSDCRSDEVCGNGLLDPESGEACDDGNTVSGDGCQADCRLPSCGDGIVDAGEVCDDGNNVFGDGCNARCTSDETCGNGVVDVNVVGESCDDGNNAPGDGCDASCNIERCGDGILASGEACDDGNNVSGDGCSGNCDSLEVCGNGFLDVAESCDDGNTAAGDGCSPTCLVESCGNGITDPNEVCDDGNTVSGDGCASGCDSVEICGNGVLDIGESCDDSNTEPGDGCSASCVVERCGNDVLDPGEVCDDGNGASGDGCSADCQSDETCGNSYVDVVTGETCDLGGANSNAPNAICRTNCQFRSCGDGVLDGASGEVCDRSSLGGATCQSLGFYFASPLGCTDICTFDTSECTGFCGDRTANGPEQCDAGDLNGATCGTFGFYAGSLACAANCSFDTSPCSQECGDGLVNGDEVCDGNRPARESCLDYGFEAGRLACSDFCTPGFDSCARIGLFDQPTLPFPPDIWDIWVFDQNTAYVAASFDSALNGDVRRWDGERWQQVYSDSSNEFVGVWGFDANNVWASGDDGTILFFDGSSWSVQRENSAQTFVRDGWAASPTNAFALLGGSVLRYNGSSWTTSTTTAASTLWDIEGSSGSNVYAVGSDRTVVRFNGTTWSTITPPSSVASTVDFRGLWLNGTELWVAGDSGTVARYNGGTSWSVFSTPSTTTLLDIWGTSSTNIYAAGINGTLWRYDGSGWAEIDTGVSDNVLAIDGLSDGSFWVTTNGAQILFSNGNAFGESPPSLGDLRAAWAADNIARYYVAGRQLYGQRFNLTGWVTFAAANGSFDQIVNDMWGSSSSNVYAAATGGRVLRTTGGAWLTTTVSAAFNMKAIWGTSSSNIFLFGYNFSNSPAFQSAYWRFDGTTWTLRQYLGEDQIEDVYGAGSTYFAVGANGRILRYNSGSDTWSAVSSGTNASLRGVWGSGNSPFFAVGAASDSFEAVILEWNGSSWTPVELDPLPGLLAIDGSSSSDIFAVGGEGTVLHYDGVEWSPVDVGSTDSFHSVAYGFRNRVILAGDDGVIELNRRGSAW